MAKPSLQDIFAGKTKPSLQDIFAQPTDTVTVDEQEFKVPEGIDPEEFKARFQDPEFLARKQEAQESRASLEQKERNLQRLRMVGQGTTFGLAEEAEAALTGQPVEQIRGEMKEFRKDRPLQSMGLEVLGGIGGAGISGLGKAAGQFVGRGAGAIPQIARAAGVGAGVGAVEGAGRGEGLIGRTKQAAVSGLLGGVLGGAIPAVGKLTKGIKEKLLPEFSGLLEKSGLKQTAQKAAKKGTSLLDEAGEKEFKALADVAKRSEKHGGELAEEAIQKLRGQPRELGVKLKSELGDAVFENIDEAMIGTKSKATPIYQKLSSVSDITEFAAKDKTDDLTRVLLTADVDDAVQKVMRLNPELARKGARHLDTLNAAKSALYQSDRPTADALNKVLKESIPDYKEASAVWSEFKDIQGADIGKKMLGTGTRVRDIKNFVESAKPIERKTALTSFVDDYVEKLMTAKDTTGQINTIKSPAFQEKLSLLVGNKVKAKTVIQLLEKQSIKSEGYKNIAKASKIRFPDLFIKEAADVGPSPIKEAIGDVASAIRSEEQMADIIARSTPQQLLSPKTVGIAQKITRPISLIADPMARGTGVTPGILSGTLLGGMNE